MARKIGALVRIVVVTFAGALFVAGVYFLALWQLSDSEPTTIEAARADAKAALTAKGLSAGMPAYIRIFKLESELELWMEKAGRWALFKTFPICAWSGKLGPKLREGDRQSPEGFYQVRNSSLNPNSNYHLSFNLGFPNYYDRSRGRTGSFLMVHGSCVSIGCYAMTDPGIEVIYRIVEAALKNGQQHVPVHIFPFRMSDENMKRNAASIWSSFWDELKPAYQLFEATQRLPEVTVQNGSYAVAEFN